MYDQLIKVDISILYSNKTFRYPLNGKIKKKIKLLNLLLVIKSVIAPMWFREHLPYDTLQQLRGMMHQFLWLWGTSIIV